MVPADSWQLAQALARRLPHRLLHSRQLLARSDKGSWVAGTLQQKDGCGVDGGWKHVAHINLFRALQRTKPGKLWL